MKLFIASLFCFIHLKLIEARGTPKIQLRVVGGEDVKPRKHTSCGEDLTLKKYTLNETMTASKTNDVWIV